MDPIVQQQIDEAIKYRDAQRARDVLILATKDNQIQLPRPDYLRLNYLRMNSLDIDHLISIVKESILEAYKIPNFELEQKLGDYFDLLEYTKPQVDFIYKLKAAIEQNQELLGDQKITVTGKAVPPTIANWLQDYQSLVVGGNQDALGELKYINTGPNLKILTIPQRKILQSILKIYDHVAMMVELWESIPDKLPPDQLKEFKDYAAKKFEEEYGAELEQPIVAEEPISEEPEITPPQEIPPIKDQNIIPEPELPQTPQSPYKIAPQKDLDLSTQPKKGLVFDIPTNIDLKQEAASREKRAEQKLKELKIRTKLEELKNRNKSQTKS